MARARSGRDKLRQGTGEEHKERQAPLVSGRHGADVREVVERCGAGATGLIGGQILALVAAFKLLSSTDRLSSQHVQYP